VPHALYQRLKGVSGLGLGDAKLTCLAGAWFGIEGAAFVLFAGALQSVLTAIGMRITGTSYKVPESVAREIAELREQSAAGDADARAALDEDPMAAELEPTLLHARLPLGPFLALACLEFQLARSSIVQVIRWLL
jgi:leader peptidase (prepilin peptidase)/N-methyltransferase